MRKPQEKGVSVFGYLVLVILFTLVLFKYRWNGFFVLSGVLILVFLIIKFEEYQWSKTPQFNIYEYDPTLAEKFKEINVEWISKMFNLEPKDEKVLNDPQTEIVSRGGHILFVTTKALGVVGT